MKTIFITGASSGIGKATAELFADRDWNVVATMRNPQAGADLARRPNLLVTALDVQKPDTIRAAVDSALARFGNVDVLLNNAGQSITRAFEDTTPEVVRELFDVNVFGVLEVTRALLPHFRQRRAGVIGTVSSVAGQISPPLGSIYGASKFAIEGYSEALALELQPLGITVKLLEPGAVRTEMFARAQAETQMEDYRDHVAAINKFYTAMAQNNIEEVAATAQHIHDALTDGTPRLRYPVTAGAQQFLELRRSKTDEELTQVLHSMVEAAASA